MKDEQVWMNRWKVLKKLIVQLESDIESTDNQLGDVRDHEQRIPSLKKLVLNLKDFGEKQFEFFINGFKGDGYLEQSTQLPPEYVLREALDQISRDLMVIDTAFQQRKNGVKREALKQADLLAHRALVPVLTVGADDAAENKKLLPKESVVITYFQKFPEVRILPYAQATLIGIPFSSTPDFNPDLGSPYDQESNLRDLLAIPHEVGHFVYWNGRLKGERLHTILKQQVIQSGLVKYVHWLEEIFADVYGCLVGGSVFALSSQEIQMDNRPVVLTQDDGSHPSGILRPYIAIHVIQSRIGESSARILKEHWEAQVKTRGNPKTFQLKPKDSTGIESVEINNVIESTAQDNELGAIIRIIDIILNLLDTNAFVNPWSDNLPPASSDIYSLYKSFGDKLQDVNSLFNIQKFDSDVPNDFGVPDKDTSWVYQLREYKDPVNRMPPEIWQVVLTADGWGSGGGEGDGNSKNIE